MAGLFDFASGAVKDIYGAQGDAAEAKAYGQAEQFSKENASIEQTSTAIQEYQAGRALYQTQGKALGAAGGNGLTGGGSAADIIRANASQGSLQKQIIGAQGQINTNAYEAEAAQYSGMKGAAEAAQTGQEVGAGLNIIGGIASLFGF